MRSVMRGGIGAALAAIATWMLIAGPTDESVVRGGEVGRFSPASPGPIGLAVPSPSAVGRPIPTVPAEVPTKIAIPALELSAPVRVMSSSTCPVLDPPTLQDAYWVGCRAMPGTDSLGTVFIIGHTVAGGSAVFNGLQRLEVGAQIELTTRAGILFYRVSKTAHYAKDGEVQRSSEVRDKVPGRLVLVTCYLASGDEPTNENYLVQADLIGASPVV